MEENINQFEDSNPIKDHIRVKNEDIIDRETLGSFSGNFLYLLI